MRTEEVHKHLIGKSYYEVIENLQFQGDSGDCCGYFEYEALGTIPSTVLKEDLTLKGCVRIGYDSDKCSAREVLNFVFNDKLGNEVILGYELEAGSGSGWSYGAYVQMYLGEEILAEVEW